MPDPDSLNFNLVDAQPGRLALSICPGRHEPGRPGRNLDNDLDQLVTAGARALVSLIEAYEFELLGISTQSMSEACAQRDLVWEHLPIRDMGVPDDRFAAHWQRVGPAIHKLLDASETVVLHCRGGLGRSGTIAAQILIERGAAPASAKAIVRSARPGAIETCPQASYLSTLA